MKTAVFANSKGGVGKSTIALLTSLSLATKYNRANVELIDLDPQATTSDSLSRFANYRFKVINNEEFYLGSTTPNNSRIISHLESSSDNHISECYSVIDCPAGNDPVRSTFLLHSDIIFIPTSVSDADVFATKKYIASLIDLFESDVENSPKKPPLAVILPSMIDHRDELNELRSVLAGMPVYFGKPLKYSPNFRRAFRAERDDSNVKILLKEHAAYSQWITDLFIHSDRLKLRPKKLFQL